MPRLDFTDITIVLDRSGSMQSVAEDTIGGFNRFVEDQKTGHGDAVLTLVQFDDQYEVVYNAAPIATAAKLTDSTFVPRGSTALLDAIGRTIEVTGARFAAAPEHERPEQVIIMILTDGHENASAHYTNAKIAQMIAHQRDVYSWEFVFLAANQDAIATGGRMGISSDQSLTYAASKIGTNAAFDSISASTKRRRSIKDKAAFIVASDRAVQDAELQKGH
ncbi:MAG: VWA domain-containing protein [bacterium]|nr:VWA domain-containing protein [Candidatus Kapabacteria bacterium]